MQLKFPNPSRSYNASKQCVNFRGYDTLFEVHFHLAQSALGRLGPHEPQDEAGVLAAFDRHRGRIERAANEAYRRGRGPVVILTAADF